MITRQSYQIAKPATSLRVRLTAIILVPLLLIALALGIWQLDYTRQKAEGLFDRSLLSTGLAIAADVARSGGDALSLETRDLLNDTSGGQVYYHAFAPSGVYVTGYATPPARPPEAVAAIGDAFYGFYDSTYFGSPVRALRLRQVNTVSGISGTYTYTVWQERAVLDALARDLAWQVMVVMGVLIGTVALVVWFGVNLGLRPLLDLEDAISRRNSDDLSPIRRRVPPEARGLVLRLNALFEQVEATIQAQASFVSNAAHQLRNPIAGVLAMAEAVRRAPTPEDTRARAGELLSSARQVRDLANRLLTLERASAAGQARERVALGALLTEIARDQQARAVAQAVDLVLDLGKAQAVVMADRLMLREAVLNLIDNALRHGGPNLRHINIGLAVMDGHAQLSVRDDGRGLSPDEVPLALARFGQVGTTEGSGLGLSITAAVVATHGGQLDIAPSAASRAGLQVTMRLPLADESQQPSMALAGNGNAAPARVLGPSSPAIAP
ncbi:sensor histidine kinase [Roseicyclus sp.]|uniref:sensor histidine kinase n=1 Tax=Roseicyclus sp. TaxID=1914329 RepID=UPI001BCB9CB1|nr:sensor histidine kinase [Roseicyclus sp.]